MMKYIFAFLIICNGLISSGEVMASDVKEFQMQAVLSAMNLQESAVVINKDEVIVDYIMKDRVRNKDDISTQLQMIFIAAAKVAPETTITVVKGRYVADYDPVIYVVVPTKATLFFMEGIIDPDEFWSFVSFNDPDIIKEINQLEPLQISAGWWYLLGFILSAGFIIWWQKWRKNRPVVLKEKKKTVVQEPKIEIIEPVKQTVSPSAVVADPKVVFTKKDGLWDWTHGNYGWFRKLVTLLFNLCLPGFGYFVLGKRYLKKGFLFILITLLLLIFTRQLVLFFYVYIFVDMIMLFKSKE